MASPSLLLALLPLLLAHQSAGDGAAGASPAGAAAAPEGVDAIGTADYELVGHGFCVDARQQKYEQWYLPGYKASQLTFKGDVSNCSCPECHEACDLFLVCLGFEYYCCPQGDRCISGGAVVFGKGRRPGVFPPGNFSVDGVYGGATSGPDFNGTGRIEGVEERGPHGFCYRKSGPMAAPPPAGETFVGKMYEPHTMPGTTRTLVPNWQACQLHCQSQPKCETWGFWPDSGCHLQGSNTTLVAAKCAQEGEGCAGLGVISGPRNFADKSWQPVLRGDPAAITAIGGNAASSDGTPARQNLSETVITDASVLTDPGEGGLRGALVLVLLLVVAGLALYMSAQADWSKRRKKKRRMKEASRRKEMEASFSANSMSGGSDGEESETDSDEEVHPLSRKKAPKV